MFFYTSVNPFSIPPPILSSTFILSTYSPFLQFLLFLSSFYLQFIHPFIRVFNFFVSILSFYLCFYFNFRLFPLFTIPSFSFFTYFILHSILYFPLLSSATKLRWPSFAPEQQKKRTTIKTASKTNGRA